mmetsp:Transcript_19942/g.45269  ORF Transcript_19942/g.45269 Transcript_19942/m.45269 type:complete len:211 (+) Transcript_19942:1374-2006(+)
MVDARELDYVFDEKLFLNKVTEKFERDIISEMEKWKQLRIAEEPLTEEISGDSTKAVISQLSTEDMEADHGESQKPSSQNMANAPIVQAVKNVETLQSKIVLGVKNENLDIVEEVLDQNISPDTMDHFGNTLLILACQQGSKRMCKFLIRRGGSINLQNHAGNTGLHYLHTFNNSSLADYLIQKGADDSLLNAEGLTCYEGLRREDVENI